MDLLEKSGLQELNVWPTTELQESNPATATERKDLENMTPKCKCIEKGMRLLEGSSSVCRSAHTSVTWFARG